MKTKAHCHLTQTPEFHFLSARSADLRVTFFLVLVLLVADYQDLKVPIRTCCTDVTELYEVPMDSELITGQSGTSSTGVPGLPRCPRGYPGVPGTLCTRLPKSHVREL